MSNVMIIRGRMHSSGGYYCSSTMWNEKVDDLKIGMDISVRRNIVVPVPRARYRMVNLHLQLPVDRFSAQKGEIG